MKTVDDKALQREILLGFWKVHILCHAAQAPLVGHWMLQELRRHGYDVSPGTLYPILKRMEALGWLRCEASPETGPKAPRPYVLTDRGRVVLAALAEPLRELTAEAGAVNPPRKPTEQP